MSASPRIGRTSLFFANQVAEFRQFLRVQIGNRPEGHAGIGPVNEMVTALGNRRTGCFVSGLHRPDKQVDEVTTALINERRGGVGVDVIQSAADERKSVR